MILRKFWHSKDRNQRDSSWLSNKTILQRCPQTARVHAMTRFEGKESRSFQFSRSLSFSQSPVLVTHVWLFFSYRFEPNLINAGHHHAPFNPLATLLKQEVHRSPSSLNLEFKQELPNCLDIFHNLQTNRPQCWSQELSPWIWIAICIHADSVSSVSSVSFVFQYLSFRHKTTKRRLDIAQSFPRSLVSWAQEGLCCSCSGSLLNGAESTCI